MSDIFISYSRSTPKEAQQIAEALRALGYGVWRDDDIPAHRAYADVIAERLAAAKAVVVVWSAEAARSEWVRSEAESARATHKLVQLTVDGAKLPMPFDQIECAGLVGWTGDPDTLGWRKVLSSVAELTAIAPTSQPTPPPRPAGRPGLLGGRRVLAAVGLLAILAIGAALAWRFAAPRTAPAPGQNGRVEVMLFQPQTPDPELQKVAADFSGSLVQMLAGAGVQVAERPVEHNSAGSDAELRVAGTVAREGAGFVINPQVLDRKTGLILWTDRLETAQQRNSGTGGVAYSIAAIVHCAIEDRKGAHSPISTEAFGLYTSACAAVLGSHGGPERMLSVTRQLVKVAPEFAGGHAMHAIAAARAAEGVKHVPAEAAALHAEAKVAAEQALKLDPRQPKAYAALALNEGALGDRVDQNRLLQEQYLLKALKLDPDLPPARIMYASLLRTSGRTNEAIEAMRAMDARDPRTNGDSRIALLLASTGDLAGAEAALTNLENATQRSERVTRYAIAFWWEDPKVAVNKLRAMAPEGASADQIDCQLTFLKELDARRAGHTRGLPASCHTADPDWQARMLAREGDVDGAFAVLQPSFPGKTAVLYLPEMKAVRRDPRFWPLVTGMGLTDYWLKSAHWPDFCAEPDLPYDCKAAAMAAVAGRPPAST